MFDFGVFFQQDIKFGKYSYLHPVISIPRPKKNPFFPQKIDF